MSVQPDHIPLAERMRPRTLDGFIGQQHLVGEGKPLRNIIASGKIPSMIFWGPPGVGKTTLAGIIAASVQVPFYELSAIHSGVKEVREVIEKAKGGGLFSQSGRPILFIDEIHRFSKSQQDSLLGAVEKGLLTLIGATTENPSFEVIPALLSRAQTYVLQHLGLEDLLGLANQACEKDEYLRSRKASVKDGEVLVQLSGGDGRKLLNLLEMAVQQCTNNPAIIDSELLHQVAHKSPVQYDKGGEWHYDIISAFIKSIRGSDPNGAVYWLARMVEGGEDPSFIARRMLILASEDIGNANPTALVIANNCFQAVNVIGWPESRIILSQCAIYLATSAKSNASYAAIDDALETVRNTGNLGVPLPLRNAPTKFMKELGYGQEYLYAHSFEGNFVNLEFLPDEIKGKTFYHPGANKREEEIRNWLRNRWKDKYGY